MTILDVELFLRLATKSNNFQKMYRHNYFEGDIAAVKLYVQSSQVYVHVCVFGAHFLVVHSILTTSSWSIVVCVHVYAPKIQDHFTITVGVGGCSSRANQPCQDVTLFNMYPWELDHVCFHRVDPCGGASRTWLSDSCLSRLGGNHGLLARQKGQQDHDFWRA